MDRNDPSVFTLLNAVTTTGAGSGIPFQSEGAAIYVYSATTSSCTVLIQGSLDNTNWFTLVTITDPAAPPAGTFYAGTAMPYLRCNVSARVSGTITAKAVALSEDPGRWNSIVAPSNTATAIACTTLTASSLTATRVPYASTGGLLVDEAAFTYTAGTNTLAAENVAATAVTCTSVTASGLTVTRVPFAGTGGLLEDEAAFAYTKGTNTLAVENVSSTLLKGGAQVTCNAYAVDGAISVAPQVAMLTQDAVGAYTLAAPTTTTHDGYVMHIVATKARAHVITFAAGTINGGTNVTITLGGAIGDGATLVAYQGVWWMVSAINATVAA